MVSLSEAKAVNASYKPPYIPTAIFVGGTSGIGRAMAAHLARTTNGACKIIIIGRNPTAASDLLASLPPPPPASGVTHEFVQCDVRLMKNVHATAGALKAQLGKVNFLVLSTGVLRLGGRKDTEEGVDEKLALIYYSRWAFVHDLMPLLEAAAGKGEEAKVMSVLAAGTPLCGEVDLDDLGMVRSYGGFKAMRVAPTYNDLMLEKFAALHPKVSFTHVYPGTVLTNIFFPTTFPWKLLNPLIYAIVWPFSTSPDTCAEYMWCALHTAGPGFHRMGERAQDRGMAYYKGTEEAREKLWEHTKEVTKSEG
ncbi:hypothetical protein FPV67DRAFT_1422157 [Lyophyllum atratum]|nr:hypothetical protein FPV67DRAFT_1422157 [Lyophyllum atratum]